MTLNHRAGDGPMVGIASLRNLGTVEETELSVSMVCGHMMTAQ